MKNVLLPIVILALFSVTACTSSVPSSHTAAQPTPNPLNHTASTGSPRTQVIDVSIRGYAFDPAIIRAGVGDTIRFTNYDPVSHTATTINGTASFDSGAIRQGHSYEYVVEKSGTTQGHCTIHPSMTFTLEVQ